MTEDTIIALSSAHGRGAVAVIRISGDKSYPLLMRAFFPHGKITERKAVYGILDTGTIKDDIIAVWYKAPNSYTGEDVVELFTHGSSVITENIIRYFIKNGARQATRGEFTRRAFENNKLTLTESEGIIDIIDAQSESAVRAAYNLASGELTRKITNIRKKTADLTAELNVALDYPEENLETENITESRKKCLSVLNEVQTLADTYESGRKIRSGVSVVIAGKPNAGKSTLMNALVGYERAIVTEEAGTTRDTVEATYIYNGVLFNVTDTAGVRNDFTSRAEELGIERSLAAVKGADIVVALDDSVQSDKKNTIKINAKCDLEKPKNANLCVSGKTGEGVKALKDEIFKKTEINTSEEVMLTNLRQYEALCRCGEALKRAAKGMEKEAETEIITVDLLEALSALGSVDGATATRDVVDSIFARFCVGK